MIKISYTNNNKSEDTVLNGKVKLSNDASLIEIMDGLVKICQFAGYSENSFDNMIDDFIEARQEMKAHDIKYRFIDYLIDCY